MTTSIDQNTPKTMSPKWNSDGLLPAIAQDARTGEVLMMAWMNEESLALLLRKNRPSTGLVHDRRFGVRGESSGNVQTLIDAP